MKHFKRFLGALALAGLLSLSLNADAQSNGNSRFGGWRMWCEVNPYENPPVERCWYIRYNPGKGKGTKKGGKK
jgi:hypothetical protein